MKKFIAIYNTPAAVREASANMSKEDHQKGMQAWFNWKEKCGNHIVDFGAPLLPAQAVSKGTSWKASSSSLNGYSILQGNNLEEVQALFADHPHLHWAEGTSIELHEFMPM